jgi:uridylate kinase
VIKISALILMSFLNIHSDIKSITELNVQVAIVIGGGNIYRGMNEAETGIERAHGDYHGNAGNSY